MKQPFLIFCLTLNYVVTPLHASEVIQGTHTRVIVREHPKTGKPYVSIISPDINPAEDPFTKQRAAYSRPDYRMLDPRMKSGEIPYDGPYSSSKKVYIFAATLATLGTVGGAIGLATVPLASGGAAAGGGAYLAAGGAVVAGTATGAVIANKSNPQNDDFTQISKSVWTGDGSNRLLTSEPAPPEPSSSHPTISSEESGSDRRGARR